MSNDRDFGRLEGRLDAIEKRQVDLEMRIDNRLKSIDGSLEELTELLHQGRGAARLGAWILGALAMFGGLVSWLVGSVSGFKGWS